MANHIVDKKFINTEEKVMKYVRFDLNAKGVQIKCLHLTRKLVVQNNAFVSNAVKAFCDSILI